MSIRSNAILAGLATLVFLVSDVSAQSRATRETAESGGQIAASGYVVDRELTQPTEAELPGMWWAEGELDGTPYEVEIVFLTDGNYHLRSVHLTNVDGQQGTQRNNLIGQWRRDGQELLFTHPGENSPARLTLELDNGELGLPGSIDGIHMIPLRRVNPQADSTGSLAREDKPGSRPVEYAGTWHANEATSDFRRQMQLDLFADGTGMIGRQVFPTFKAGTSEFVPVRWSVENGVLRLDAGSGFLEYPCKLREGSLFVDFSRQLGYAVEFSRDSREGRFLPTTLEDPVSLASGE